MKHLLIFTSAFALVAPVAVGGEPRQEDVTVRGGQPSRAEWVSTLTKRIDTMLERKSRSLWNEQRAVSGIVTIQFQADESNFPSKMVLLRSSQDTFLNRSSMRVIKNLGTLPAFPSSFSKDQVFRVNMIYAEDYLDYREKLRVLAKDQTRSLVAHGGAGDTLAMVVTLNAVSAY